ncbi:ATP-binding protein [Syntrophobacter fumaroxidans]|uniref:histidine kinase n=1 Tax=Syntrophobacter fumaroxidans (strain DSM 10017 / MPOB) TaxID=335543 RepID=A0LJL6_SYNFM|nr:ATP-binding protein [Syntrophobacter fumaroxidans]ABK17618.1 PAS/PAC sensor signal transduction histidine kinase [Syntrophobacter fumaroxidans MPOB]
MNSSQGPPDKTSRRRTRERILVIAVFAAIITVGFFEGWFFRLQSDLPLSGNILLFAFININVILLLLLAYLVLRNIVKLVFERKRNILGHKLRTRLVIASVGLTLIPTIPLFWLATQFIFSSLDQWFSYQVEQSLEQAVGLGKNVLEREGADLVTDARSIKAEVLKLDEEERPAPAALERISSSYMGQYRIDGLFLFDGSGRLTWKTVSPELGEIEPGALRKLLEKESEQTARSYTLSSEAKREGLAAHVFFPRGSGPTGEGSELIAFRLLPPHIMEKLGTITGGYEDYLQLKLLHFPLKQSHFITFSIVTLLTIFAAIWFGFFIARSLTVPIQALVSATQRIAEGDLEVHLESQRQDELGMLITSFNDMVEDLRESRGKLANAYLALQQSHLELENRRRYMEVVLKNIAAGVVSVDAGGRIMTMNKAAEETFGLHADRVKGLHYSSFLRPAHLEIVKSFTEMYESTRQPYLEQQVQVVVGEQPMTLLINASVLKDEKNEFMGVVAVLDDLTELEKAQRMAAWREVARRIAHEIKNPLTPIQLSAQRLRRKHPELLEEADSVFDECTRTIIQQVDHMKHLVNEFSKFARLPRARPVPSDLCAIIEESLALYRHTYPNISFVLEKMDDLPPLRLDRDQFRQVMINLIENAVYAIGREKGVITNRVSYDPVLNIARMECADTGRGISPEGKLRMFEPYYSTRRKGTGLGLAIVASIIADHNGFVRVRDNVPAGTVIVIELPGR